MQAKNVLWKLSFILLSSFILFGCAGKASLRGEPIKSSAPAAEIDLPDQNGNNFQLGAMRGKVVLVFFGFTNCVDECPLTMAHIKQALDALGSQSQDVQVVFISTDPVRDSPQLIKEYLNKFNPSFIGIAGTYDTLKTVWDAYDVTVLEGGETHSSFTYVVDKSGALRETFDPDTAPDDIAHDLETLLAE
jgi:protein SCO1